MGESASAEKVLLDGSGGGPSVDERISYRGLFSRMLIRPDIGALIGVVAIWAFFWAVSIPFGTANGATTVLDVSSTLGIMAVAVAILMIGGEFDLSSGANTGAMGILVILLVKETGDIGGLGLHYWFAIPISLAIALGVGWLNGWMVERFTLPSFIATLATFFVLRGAKLGFSKRIVDQIQVGRADEGAGYERWQNVFAATWERNVHQFQARDLLYLVLILAGLSMLAVAVFEFSFRLRAGAGPLGLTGYAMLALGATGLLAWFEWSRQDNVGIENLDATWSSFTLRGDDHITFLGKAGATLTWTGAFYLGVLIGVGAIIQRAARGASLASLLQNLGTVGALVALEAAIRRRPYVLIGMALLFVVVGIAALLASMVRESGEASDGGSARSLSGLGASLAGLAVVAYGVRGMHHSDGMDWDQAAIIGVGALVAVRGLGAWRYQTHAIAMPRVDRGVLLAAGVGAVLLVVAVLFAQQLDSTADTQIWFFFTEQGLRAMAFGAFAAGGILWMLIGVSRAARISAASKSLMLTLAAVAVAVVAFVIRSESGSAKFRAELFGIMIVVALLMFAWAVTGFFFDDRREIDAGADESARWLGLVGVLVAASGLLVKLFYTMQYEFTRDRPLTPAILSVRTLWFLGFTAVCAWVLSRTRWGSWVYAVGGNKQASRQVGVPAARTKSQLFMLVAFAAWLVGMLLAFRLNTIQASTGDGLEFEYIIAAVVGGTFLTGGNGTVIGAALGAVIMAISKQGIPFSGWNSDWRFVFLGLILLLAVVANGFIRSKAEAAR